MTSKFLTTKKDARGDSLVRRKEAQRFESAGRRGSPARLSKLCSGPRDKGLQRARHAVCYAVNCSCPCHEREAAA